MNATDIVASYAAIVSTAALGWEFWKERRARRPDVRVILAEGIAYVRDPDSGRAYDEVLLVEVRNFGPYPVRVESVGFYAGPDRMRPMELGPVVGEIPGIVPSHDSAVAWYAKEILRHRFAPMGEVWQDRTP